jgi:hypothetical protein
MKTIFITSLVAVATPLGAWAQAKPADNNPNRFSLGPRFGLNFKADFSRSGGAAAGSNPGPATGGGIDRTYDDGYVRVDSSGNDGGLTWNWGYQNSGQVVGDTLQFHSTLTTSPSAISGASDDPQMGLELTYQRVLGELGSRGKARWGFEAAFSYTDIGIRARRSQAITTSQITDTYALNGVLPPAAPYAGTFGGPGPLLSDSPTRTVGSATATLATQDELSGSLFGIRLGPFAELDLGKRWALNMSGGFVLAPTTLDYNFTDTTTPSGGSPVTTRGSTSETEVLYGAYASCLLNYAVTERWSLYGGGQFQYLTDFETTTAGHTARLDAGATFFGVFGVQFKF